MPHSSKTEGRHCLWMGETSVAQGTPLHRAQTLAGTNLTDCSCEQHPSELWDRQGQSLAVLDQSLRAPRSGQGQAGDLCLINCSVNGIKF